MSKEATIHIAVNTDENKVPERIVWSASDANISNRRAKAMILAMWDEQDRNTLRMDLWDKEMDVEEMKFFVHQTMLTLADSFEKATGEDRMALSMRDFCEYFAEKMDLRPGKLGAM
ncbi:MAG: gliding motility protein GldC [Flavobacteriales bacterium]|jgi:gliding motility-associated protein GldC|nr:gliding motility protein GldC [Flavobacteriales bacterium]